MFDIDEQIVFNTQDVGCLKQMPGGDWKMTEQDDDTIAVMNLRWCPPPNDMFMAATATGGILAMWQVSISSNTCFRARNLMNEIFS